MTLKPYCLFFLLSEIESDADDQALMLAASHGDFVQVWHLGHINGTVTYSGVTTGSTLISCFEDSVVDLAFSPDGTALAVASLDGFVKFLLVFELPFILFLLKTFSLM